jgi:flagellar secretion chaperone FliS
MMTQRNNPWQSYRKVAAQTASPGQLVLMLYDGAIRFLERSLTGFNLEDPLEFNQTISNNILRAQDIVRELNVTLNMEAGGEVAANFRRLYDYFDRQLQEGNVRKKKEPIEEVVKHLRVIRDSWADMLRGQGGEASATAGRPSVSMLQAAAA